MFEIVIEQAGITWMGLGTILVQATSKKENHVLGETFSLYCTCPFTFKQMLRKIQLGQRLLYCLLMLLKYELLCSLPEVTKKANEIRKVFSSINHYKNSSISYLCKPFNKLKSKQLTTTSFSASC